MVVLSTSRYWSAVTARPARAAPIDAQRSAAAGTDSVLHDTYTLGKRIGEGGMADIFEATHLRLHGRFAIKLMRTDMVDNEAALALFRREASALNRLDRVDHEVEQNLVNLIAVVFHFGDRRILFQFDGDRF